METIVERHGTKAKFGDGSSITIPADRSILNFTSNKFFDGALFAKDGYIYSNGMRIKRWTSYIYNTLIWEPHLKDINHLEERYHFHLQNYEKKALSKWRKWFEKYPNQSFRGYLKNNEVLFTIDRVGVTWSYSEWKKEHRSDINTIPFNEDAVTEYFLLENMIKKYSRRHQLYQKIFIYAVQNELHTGQWKQEDLLHLFINDREYWFNIGSKGDFKILATPQNIREVRL
jgi:hypothetical protein